MVRRIAEEPKEPLPPPATTLEGREDQLISAAIDLIEKRIYDGTASAQETLHFAKQGTVRNQMELEKIKNENLVLQTRVKEMENRRSGDELLERALNAFRGYSGQAPILEDEDEDLF